MKVSLQEAINNISENLKEIWADIAKIESEIEQLKSPSIEFFDLKRGKGGSFAVKGCFCPKCQSAISLRKVPNRAWSFNCHRCGVQGNVEFGASPANLKEKSSETI